MNQTLGFPDLKSIQLNFVALTISDQMENQLKKEVKEPNFKLISLLLFQPEKSVQREREKKNIVISNQVDEQ